MQLADLPKYTPSISVAPAPERPGYLLRTRVRQSWYGDSRYYPERRVAEGNEWFYCLVSRLRVQRTTKPKRPSPACIQWLTLAYGAVPRARVMLARTACLQLHNTAIKHEGRGNIDENRREPFFDTAVYRRQPKRHTTN